MRVIGGPACLPQTGPAVWISFIDTKVDEGYDSFMVGAVASSLIAVSIISLISLVGLFTISIKELLLKKIIFILVALAIGALLGDAFIHLIPEAFEEGGNATKTSLLIIVGLLLFFILEKTFNLHHEHEGCEHEGSPSDVGFLKGIFRRHGVKPLGRLILVSDGIHNFIDGLIIAGSFMAGIEVGIATTIAIALHEIPQEIGDFGILIHAGFKRKEALLYNFISALMAIVGVSIVFLMGVGAANALPWVLPISAGVFIYIASADLIPELHKRRGIKSAAIELVAIGVGILAMYLLTFFEL